MPETTAKDDGPRKFRRAVVVPLALIALPILYALSSG